MTCSMCPLAARVGKQGEATVLNRRKPDSPPTPPTHVQSALPGRACYLDGVLVIVHLRNSEKIRDRFDIVPVGGSLAWIKRRYRSLKGVGLQVEREGVI